MGARALGKDRRARMAEQVNPEGYGRKPSDGPSTSRAELNRRQAERLNSTDNGTLEDGRVQLWVTPERSATG
jgi:hypothetical protein